MPSSIAYVSDALRENGHDKAAARIESCGDDAMKLCCQDCGRYSRVSLRCMSRICPECARSYAQLATIKWTETISELQSRGAMKAGYTLKLLTLTLAHNGTVQERVDRIKTYFKRFWKEYLGNAPSAGALVVIEIAGEEHVHLHALVYGPYRNNIEMSYQWKLLTGDSRIVRYEALRKGNREGVWYVLKYLSKGLSGGNDQSLLEIYESMLHKRRIWTVGLFYNPKATFRRHNVCPWCAQVDELVPNWSRVDSIIEYREPIFYYEGHDPPNDEW